MPPAVLQDFHSSTVGSLSESLVFLSMSESYHMQDDGT